MKYNIDMITFEDYNGLLSYIKYKRIIIYGNGTVARRFFLALRKHKLDSNVVYFAVTYIETCVCNLFLERSVISINDLILDDDSIICIAVHDSIKDDIINELKKRGYVNYIWIYPYIFDLYMGVPLETNVKIPTRILIDHCMDYRLAVRYLAIENYFGLNTRGSDIYIKSQRMSCSDKSAIKRLDYFCRLINEFQNERIDYSKSVLIDSNYLLFDGAHRLSLYIYFKKQEIQCNIFSPELDIVSWLSPEGLMEKECFSKPYFSWEELRIIDYTYKKIRGER